MSFTHKGYRFPFEWETKSPMGMADANEQENGTRNNVFHVSVSEQPSCVKSGKERKQVMISAFDVKYFENGSVMAAAAVFKDFKDAEPASLDRKKIKKVHEYVSGSFYRRELACILSLLSEMSGIGPGQLIDMLK